MEQREALDIKTGMNAQHRFLELILSDPRVDTLEPVSLMTTSIQS
jgi:hypothetical protein